MISTTLPDSHLLSENAELRARLEESEETLRAIRTGEVDALVVDGAGGPQVFILQSSDAESNRFRSDILAKVSDAVIAVDNDERVIFLNAAAESQYGVISSQVLGNRLDEIYQFRWLHAGDEAAFATALGKTGHWRGESIHIKRGGRVIHVESSVSRLSGKDGEPSGLLAVIRDITDRGKAQEALRDSERRFREMIDSLPAAIYTTDAEGRLTHFNPAAVEFSGRMPDLGTDRWCVSWKLFHADGTPMAPDQCPMAVAVKEGREVRGVEAIVERPDGSRLWFTPYPTPLRDAQGKVIGGINMLLDITERKMAEEAVLRNEALFSTIINQSPGGVYVVDNEFRVYQASVQARSVFAAAEPVMGRDFAEVMQILWGPEVGEHLAGIFRHTLETGEPYVSSRFTETRHDLEDTRSYDWEIQRISLPNGKQGVVCYFADVTSQQALENKLLARSAELAQADRAKDEFLAMLAHELRNPLAPMRNAAEILEGGTGPEERKQAQRIISRQIENMSRMIDDLLDVSRITEGKIELRKEPVELEGILRAAASLARPGCDARGQRLSVFYPAEPVQLLADATRLEQVFGNLLGNACKYGGEGCRISLSAELDPSSEPPEVVVRVRDDGIGIDSELLPRIFELFVQASRTLDRAHGGLGIGLTLVQRLVKMHGGRVEARSEGLGRGSEFIVRLPVLVGSRPEPPPNGSLVRNDKPFRMLIVDDNLDAAESMSMLQQLRGHDTRTAHTGPDAVVMATGFLPEVVLLDIGLPGMDGYQVARRLRAMPGMEGALLVAMTGYGSDDDRRRAKEAGFDEHMAKPANLDLLRKWLRARA